MAYQSVGCEIEDEDLGWTSDPEVDEGVEHPAVQDPEAVAAVQAGAEHGDHPRAVVTPDLSGGGITVPVPAGVRLQTYSWLG